MINGEEKFLKTLIKDLKRYTSEHPDALSFYREINSLNGFSLQRLSFENDLSFFSEVNALLSVIATIIVHPHIVNAREEIVVRAEQAPALTNEMFFETMRDARLWKDKRGVMAPEQVYYTQNIDEIKTYENRFVVHLIDMVAARLNEYAAFYSFLVGTVAGELSKSSSDTERAFDKMESLSKKIRRIKETFFYREVSKAPTNFARVQPTNMLLKNRAYGACYKFYVKHVAYGDRGAVMADLKAFFFVHALGALKNCGYSLVSRGAAMAFNGRGVLFIKGPLAFEKGNFSIVLEDAAEYNGLYVTVVNAGAESAGARSAKHLLTFDPSVTFAGVEREAEKYMRAGVTSVEALSPWNAACLEGGLRVGGGEILSERQLMSNYFAEKTRMIPASRRIYETHCPVCRGRDLQSRDDVIRCSGCKSEYAFARDFGEGDNQYVWLRKLRK